MSINAQIAYFQRDGRPTLEGLKAFDALFSRVAVAEGKLAAIADLADPTGGATVDAEARAAIAEILDAAS